MSQSHWLATSAAVTGAAGLAVLWWRRKRDLSGHWYTIIRSTGGTNGDQYEFRRDGQYYYIYRNGQTGNNDRFVVNGNQIKHDHGPKATIQFSGDIHWDIEGDKYASRRKGFRLTEAVALLVPPIIFKAGELFGSMASIQKLLTRPRLQCQTGNLWPPAHTPAELEHFTQLKNEGGVDQVWLISKHDGGEYVQHNFADGTYKAYEHKGDNVVDSGKWTLKDGKYSEDSDHKFISTGKLHGNAKAFHMDVECGPHGYHKFTPTFVVYTAGHITSELPPSLPSDPDAPRLCLVKKGGPGAAVFEHAESLAKGDEFVPLTLKTRTNKAIVFQVARPERHAHFHLIAPAVGSAEIAVHARLDKEGGFLTCKTNGFILDVDKWQYKEDNNLWFLQEGEDVSVRQTRNPDGGRSFQVNLDDGTISPVKAPHLVLGLASKTQLILVPKGSNKMCIFEHAATIKAGGVVKSLTLTSPPGLAVVAKYEKPNSFGDYCEYIELGVASSAVAKPLQVSFDEETWITRDTVIVTTTYTCNNMPVQETEVKEYNMVFDVAFGKMEANNAVNMLQRIGTEPSKEPGNKAREFVINDDGTISPKAAPQLVLGMGFILHDSWEE